MPRPNRRVFGIGQLGRRLVLAFVLVALAAILIDSFVSGLSIDRDITAVAVRQEGSLSRAVALTTGAAYQGIGWGRADLSPVFDLAGRAGAGILIRDTSGKVIGSSAGFAGYPAEGQRTEAVIVRGRVVGSAVVRFSSRGLGAIARNFEAERFRARVVASVVAALLALIVSLVVARQITGPLDRMLEAARARGEGDRAARIDPVTGVGVVRDLLEAFNQSTDVTDRQDRIRRNLVANVAHELRTPLAILQAGHEAMADGITDPTPENLASLRDEVIRLAQRVDDLQSLASAEAAALQINLVPNDLAGIAAEAAASLRDSFELKGVDLSLKLAEVRVASDRRRMFEVAANLLTNALKFTPAGGTVTLEAGPSADGEALLRISDTGIGIPADELPLVTERFFRGQHAASTASGSGFGLTIVSELVRAQHGKLHIASDPGAGTTVTVAFPPMAG